MKIYHIYTDAGTPLRVIILLFYTIPKAQDNTKPSPGY
jgi:hypothetical protein